MLLRHLRRRLRDMLRAIITFRHSSAIADTLRCFDRSLIIAALQDKSFSTPLCRQRAVADVSLIFDDKSAYMRRCRCRHAADAAPLRRLMPPLRLMLLRY